MSFGYLADMFGKLFIFAANKRCVAMTIITGSTFRANQSKYIGMAYDGERVILSSRKGYVELKPVSDKDTERERKKLAASYAAVARKAEDDYKKGKGVVLRSHEDIDNYFNSL